MTTHHSEPAREAVATCPFCGSAGKMIACMGSWKPGGYEPDGRRIACSSMECITAGKPFYGESMEANAIAWWNRRASPAPAGGGPEAVRATLEEAKFALFCSDMTIKDRADQSIRLTLASLASPAASPASPNGAIIHAIASLAAAISLLERTPKAKKAAPSDRMFEQMLCDYRKALEEARAALASPAATSAETQDDLVSRAEVIRVIRTLGDQDADLALYGAADNARAREYGEAAATRACCAIALMPRALASPAETQGGDGVRCLATGNPVGTDTWQVGRPCRCANCAALAPSTSAATRGDLNPAAMTERLIDAAIYNEQASGFYVAGARKEMNEARAAIEQALSSPPAPAVESAQVKEAGDV